jgi:hypothetical protein
MCVAASTLTGSEDTPAAENVRQPLDLECNQLSRYSSKVEGAGDCNRVQCYYLHNAAGRSLKGYMRIVCAKRAVVMRVDSYQ